MSDFPAPCETTAAHVATLFGVQAQSVRWMSGGFSEASVFRVLASDGRQFAVRSVLAASAMSDDQWEFFVRLLRRMRDNRNDVIVVPIAAPIVGAVLSDNVRAFTADDRAVGTTRIRLHQHFWQTERWLPGEASSEPPSPLQLDSTLHCLRMFHEAAVKAATILPPNEWYYVGRGKSPGILRRLEIAGQLIDGTLPRYRQLTANDANGEFRQLAMRICNVLETWLPWLLQRLKPLASESFLLQPVMRDLWRAHVLFTGHSVTGLIDLSAMSTDHVGYDLTRLFRSWYRSDSEKICGAVRGYMANRSLSELDLLLFQALDASTVLLSPVTWLRRRIASQNELKLTPERIARIQEVTELAEHFQPLGL